MEKLYTEKSLRLRYMEFFSSMKLLRNSLDNVALRKEEFFISLSAQLRAMFIPNRKRSGEFKETDEFICLKLAKELGVELDLFIQPTTYEDKECKYYSHLFTTTLVQTQTNTQKQTLLEWLENDIVQIKDKKFKIYEVIKTVADQNGGAHFDKALKNEESVDLCLAKNKTGVSVVNLILAKVGEILYSLGLKIIKALFDVQMVITLALPKKQDMLEKNIITYRYEGCYSPIMINVTDKNMLQLTLSDSQAHSYSFDVFDLTYNTGLLVINVAYSITDKMEGLLEVYCNDCYSKAIIHNTVFIGYNFFVNSIVDISDDNIKVGFLNLMFYKQINTDYNIIYKKILKEKYSNVAVLNGKHQMRYQDDGSLKFDKAPLYMDFEEFMS